MYNVLVLAYLGDAIYEIKVREHLISLNNVKTLQKEVTKYVSANGQAKFITYLIDNNLLTEEEKEIYFRARNHKSNHKPKNTDIITYKIATGFEAILGSLYLGNNNERIDEIMEVLWNEKDNIYNH